MTFHGRSPDDMPLAAYGGSGMDLTNEDEARLDGSDPTDAPSGATAVGDGAGHPAGGHPSPAHHPAEPEGVPPGPFAYAVPDGALPDDNFGAGRAVPGRALPPAVTTVVTRVVTTLRTSRPAAGAAFVGVILVGLLLLNVGQGPGAAGATASPSAGPVAVSTVAPPTGEASVEAKGKLKGSWVLAGATGTGPAVGGRIATTWSDAAGSSLVLAGPASAGTRTTDATFTLTWTVLVDGAPVVFMSDAGECTVGMAVQPRAVSGSFVCKRLRSEDGKLTIDVRGTYRT